MNDAVAMSSRERFLKNLAWLANRLLFRSVEVHHEYRATAAGPQLGVSNHFGGLSDPLIQIYALDRVPRFIARDVIWRYPVAKQLMQFVRAIPVHKADDHGARGVSRNDQMFASTYDALGEGDLVVIFPEGITVDDPAIAPIKTGAARIALGARASGVDGIEIVPSGIHYEDKALLRSKVYVHVGERIGLDAWVDGNTGPGEDQGASNRELVRKLTVAIESSLRRAAPNFADWQQARMLGQAASVALRTVPDAPVEVDYAAQSALADALARRPQPARDRITEAMATYVANLDAAGLNDEQMMSTQRSRGSFLWRMAWNFGVGILLLPFALIGFVINIIPILLVRLVGRANVAPAMMATIKPGVAMVAFGIAWGVAAWLGFRVDRFSGAAAVLLLMPLYVYALVAIVERGTLILRAFSGWRRSGRTDLHEGMLADRNAVVDAVVDAL